MQVTDNMLLDMLSYQTQLNDVMKPDWRVTRMHYLRASSVEVGECHDHNAYKWWKKQEVNLPQIQLELIDMTHFIISEIARAVNEPAKEGQALLDAWHKPEPVIRFDEKDYVVAEQPTEICLDLMGAMGYVGRFSFSLLRRLMDDFKLTGETWYNTYISKSVLNLFRQHNGYKTGEYIKVWSGREDNEFLAEEMETWTPDQGADELYRKMAILYKEFALGVQA